MQTLLCNTGELSEISIDSLLVDADIGGGGEMRAAAVDGAGAASGLLCSSWGRCWLMSSTPLTSTSLANAGVFISFLISRGVSSAFALPFWSISMMVFGVSEHACAGADMAICAAPSGLA